MKLIKSINTFLVIVCTIVIVLANLLRILKCVDFHANSMQDVFGIGITLLCLMFVYENVRIDSDIKMVLIGVLCGSIVSFYDEKMIFLLIGFGVSVVWDRFLCSNSYRAVLDYMVNIYFNSMLTLEIYSIFMLFNESLYTHMTENSLLFYLIDVLFVISCVMLCCFGRDKKHASSAESKGISNKRKRYQNITRLLVWCTLIFVILFLSIEILFVGEKNATDELFFYLGKSMDRGYLFYESNEEQWLQYVVRQQEFDGGVIENLQAYGMIDLGDGFLYQTLLLHVLKYLYQFLYGIYGVAVVSLVLLVFFAYKIVRYKYGERNAKRDN